MNKTTERQVQIPPIYLFRKSFTQIRIIKNEIAIYKHYPLDLSDQTSNVRSIGALIRSKAADIVDPVILDSNFEEIVDSRFTRGETVWHTKSKSYFLNRQEWDTFRADSPARQCETHQIKFKKINYPVVLDSSRGIDQRPKSAYFPVTGPRAFRRSLTRIKILSGRILISQHVITCRAEETSVVPFELNENIAHVRSIAQILEEQLGIVDPVLLDTDFREIKDSPTTRGESYWNTRWKFYFTSRAEWNTFVAPSTAADTGSFSKSLYVKSINHPTYFDKKRETYRNPRRKNSF